MPRADSPPPPQEVQLGSDDEDVSMTDAPAYVLNDADPDPLDTFDFSNAFEGPEEIPSVSSPTESQTAEEAPAEVPDYVGPDGVDYINTFDFSAFEGMELPPILGSSEERTAALLADDYVLIKTAASAFCHIQTREALCSASAYFAAMFDGPFAESKTRTVELPDVEPWVLDAFMVWLEEKRLVLPDSAPVPEEVEKKPAEWFLRGLNYEYDPADWNNGWDLENLSDSLIVDSAVTRPTLDEPETWSWEALVRIYQFADEYDTVALRDDVLRAVQVKALQLVPVAYALPAAETVAWVAENLLPSAPLYRFFVDMLVAEGATRFGFQDRWEVVQAEVVPEDFREACERQVQVRKLKDKCLLCRHHRHQKISCACEACKDHNVEDSMVVRDHGDWCRLHHHSKGEQEEVDACRKMFEEVAGRLDTTKPATWGPMGSLLTR